MPGWASRAAPADEIGASPFNEVTLIQPYPAREITSSNLTKRMTVTLRDRQRNIMLKTGRMIGKRYTTTIKFEEVKTDNIEDGGV
jgi:hypothetical protein